MDQRRQEEQATAGSKGPEPAELARRVVRSPGWDRLVTGAGILLLAVFGLFLLRGWTAGRAVAMHPGAGVEKLVVLPPVPLSDRGGEHAWAERLAAALRIELADRVEIIDAPERAVEGQGASPYLPSLAAAAGADALLGGTLYLAQDSARLQLRLIPATSGGPRWSRRYAVPLEDEGPRAPGGPERLARRVTSELFPDD